MARRSRYKRKGRKTRKQRGGADPNNSSPDVLADTGAVYATNMGVDFNVKFQPNSSLSGAIFGNVLTKTEARPKPYTTWAQPPAGTNYLLLCWDPDVMPADDSGKTPPNTGYLHWLVVNCTGINPASGQELVPWTPPKPPSGKHRYIFGLFQQKGPLNLPAPTRENFQIATFTQTNNLTPLLYKGIRVKA